MTHEPEKAPPLADHDTATMTGKVYNQFRAAWEQRNELVEALEWAIQHAPTGAARDRVQRIIAKARGEV